MKLQTEVATLQKKGESMEKELEQVKANLKQHLTTKRTQGGGGNEAELERALAEAREALENKQLECETMKKENEKRLGDSKQFRELKALLNKKTEEVKALKQQLSEAGIGKKDNAGGSCIELEADSD